MSERTTILTVDDTVMGLTLLANLLTPEGYLVRTAVSGQLALADVAANPPDLILLDIRMRGMDGIEVCRRLKADAATSQIPIILVSAFADVSEWVEGLQAGAADYICKPFRSEELLTRVRTHLALRRAKVALEQKATMLFATTTQLEAEIARRQRVEDELRQSLEQAERAHHVLLSVLEDQKLTESRLQQSRDLLLSLAQLVPGVVYQYRLHPDGRSAFPYSSPGMNAIYEVTPEEVREDASPVFGRLHPEDRDRVSAAILASARTLEEFYCEFRVILPRQGLRWRWCQAHPERTEDGGTLWHGIISDITERKLSEIERERLTTAIEQAAEMVLITDIHGAIQYVNPAFEAVTGFTRAEVVGRQPSLQKSGAQDEAFYRALWETIREGKTWRGRMVDRRKDGTLYTQQSTISPVHDATGRITSFVAVARDITHDLDMEAQLLQSQRMESIGRLAGGIAHDFNNCLSVIHGFTQLCVDRLSEGDLQAADLGEVLKASERAAKLTHQLLAFGRKQVLQPEVLDINQVLTEMEKMLRRIIGEDIELLLKLAPDLGLVKADAGQLGQVIMNLVVNARDAMPKGGRLTVETGNVAMDGEAAGCRDGLEPGLYVMVAVADSGLGMDRQTLARIFEPFFTTKTVGKGSGLGLSTVYGIVKQSGGSISVESEVGGGTTFRVYLPRELSTNVATAARPQSLPSRAKGDETILVVEDESALRQLTARLLEDAGYTVLCASDGEQALLACERHAGTIDLLLTDVVMPRMSGRQLAERLATMRPALKILYMSGYTDDAIVHHGVLDAGTQFLAKPFDEADLTRKVRAVLDGSVSASGTDWPAVVAEVEQQPLAEGALRPLPHDVKARLRKAAVGANYDEIVEILETLRATAPDAATRLRRMADSFDYDGMQNLLG